MTIDKTEEKQLIIKGDLSSLQYYLKQGGDPQAALLLAAEHNCSDKVEFLLCSADVNSQRKTDGLSPLHLSSFTTITMMLLNVPHVKINLEDFLGRTPAHHAALLGLPDKLEALSRAPYGGVDFSLKDQAGNNLAHFVAGSGSLLTAEWVLDHLKGRTDILNAENKEGFTPGDIAAQQVSKQYTYSGSLIVEEFTKRKAFFTRPPFASPTLREQPVVVATPLKTKPALTSNGFFLPGPKLPSPLSPSLGRTLSSMVRKCPK